ncbi:MAG: nucleotidyltransferase domain-containing protein [Mediterranea sp.]|jgi:predicted nucleotidyltransferase|nr:nucleotidyltransferase domain-containing protein [Mediterranea sp.]
MKEVPQSVIDNLRKTLVRHLPRGGRAFLYGSQARGNARPDSDWDILILLDKPALLPADYDDISYPLVMLGWDIGAQINPIMYTMKEWADSHITPFYKNVEAEGVLLYEAD